MSVALEKRVWWLSVLVALWMAAIGARLIFLQVNQHETLKRRAGQQQQRIIEVSPLRGFIYDRYGRELARSINMVSIYAAPREIKDAQLTARELAGLLGLDEAELVQKLQSDRPYVPIKRKIFPDAAESIGQLGLQGIHLVKEARRFYPGEELAAHILGFVGADEGTLGGIELAYNDYINGSPGQVMIYVDGARRSYDSTERPPTIGQNVTLTISQSIQFVAERELAAAVRQSNAQGGTAIVLKPQTGEILAMASLPNYNPNNLSGASREALSNRAIQTPYEPGSVFKMVTYAAALEEGLIEPEQIIDCQGGSIIVAGHTIRDSSSYGQLTAMEAMAHSSNVAAIKLAQRIGQERLAYYIRKFGFGLKTNIDLPGESRGVVRSVKDWSSASLGAIPIGYEIGVTPLQLVSAMAAVANGGVWVQPHVVKKIASPAGATLVEANPETRRVISGETSVKLTRLLEGVVLRGTAKRARLFGYTAAGKTGTAYKYDKQLKGYSPTKHYATFAGFAPAKKPEVAIVVMIDEPRGAHHGGEVAAPVFKRIAEAVLDDLAVPADDLSSRIEVATIYQGAAESVDDLALPASARSFDVEAVKTGAANETINGVDSASILMPDLIGRGGRAAADICATLGLKLVAKGSGIVVRQSPSAWTAVSPGTICYVTLER